MKSSGVSIVFILFLQCFYCLFIFSFENNKEDYALKDILKKTFYKNILIMDIFLERINISFVLIERRALVEYLEKKLIEFKMYEYNEVKKYNIYFLNKANIEIFCDNIINYNHSIWLMKMIKLKIDLNLNDFFDLFCLLLKNLFLKNEDFVEMNNKDIDNLLKLRFEFKDPFKEIEEEEGCPPTKIIMTVLNYGINTRKLKNKDKN
jgi:hypothetical protein